MNTQRGRGVGGGWGQSGGKGFGEGDREVVARGTENGRRQGLLEALGLGQQREGGGGGVYRIYLGEGEGRGGRSLVLTTRHRGHHLFTGGQQGRAEGWGGLVRPSRESHCRSPPHRGSVWLR